MAIGTGMLIPLQEGVRICNLCIAYHVFYNKIIQNNAYQGTLRNDMYAFDNG